MLKFENVIKSFKDGNRNIEAVKDTNFEINKGDIVALVGPSGSGKSISNYGRCFTNTDIWAHFNQ
ncbi:ABC transporter ATP-binding protein [Staphylococcus aureus]|nr:ABC transporter ATP-binding protein [Staphylococcus aureus]